MGRPMPILALLLGAVVCVFAFMTAEAEADRPPSKQVALSFDDAPRGDGPFFTGPERTRRLIDALASVDVKGAMFFVTTGNIIRDGVDHAARLRAYVAAGHTLANHTHRHPWLHKTPEQDYLADIDEASRILSSFEGVQPFFRFPFLDEGRTAAKRDAIRAGLTHRGLSNGYVTVDTYDYYMAYLAGVAVKAGHDLDMDALRDAYVDLLTQSVTFYDRIAVKALGRSPRHVILLHENDLAALFIGDLVRALREGGWTIIPAVAAYADPIASREPDTLFLNQGRVGAIAREAGWAPADLVHPSEDEAYLRKEFERRGLLPETPH